MQLTRFTDLALRILMRLAVAEPDPRRDVDGHAAADPVANRSELTTQAVADQLSVRYAHAAKVVARLQKAGVVETRRGRGGGLKITERGRSLSVGRLVRELEGGAEVIECDGANPCPLRHGCRLRAALRDAQEAFFVALDPLTVSDLVASPTRQLLYSISGQR
ncbi:Rrf2 family transcriptional regulator [Microlunatus elymi]|uniref:Rrf2 family transcriptional regulator n=1 Tax=Microlunatus elymi TaxID=2596828 RepID=A0A516Q2B3_9ACTN|nr:Rrf2 family transcriptional regulator [Microlunatus elymi]QDP97351.1 Rrf2 family transcriptional regulator [Microlunatus elymi]